MSNTPSNEELDALIAEYRTRIYPQDMQPRFERAIMRAAIAKWGTPAPVEVDPVAWKHDCAALLTNDVVLWIDACPHCGKPRNAPQPAEREPLTDEQIKDLQDDGVFLGACRQIVRAIEAAHGIKGGKPCA